MLIIRIPYKTYDPRDAVQHSPNEEQHDRDQLGGSFIEKDDNHVGAANDQVADDADNQQIVGVEGGEIMILKNQEHCAHDAKDLVVGRENQRDHASSTNHYTAQATN